MDTIMSPLKSMYSPAFDVAWPFLTLGIIVMVAFRTLRMPRGHDIPWLVAVIAVSGVWTFHWIGWELGAVAGDEVAHFLPTGWTFDMYVRSDAGMPSRLYLTASWFLLHWKGFVGMRALMWVCATLIALVLLASFRRIHPRWGPWAALPVLFYYPWLRYTWEVRAYPLFLLAVCLALWHALQYLDSEEKAPQLEAVLLCLSIASIDNPIALLLALAAIHAKARRCGWDSISKRTWSVLALLLMMVFPLLVRAIGAHSGPGSGEALRVDISLLVLLAMSIPGALSAGRKGWVGETVFGTLLLLLVSQLSGVVPSDHRVMLFTLPWALAALLVWIRPSWWQRFFIVPAMVAITLFSDLKYLGSKVSQWTTNIQSAQAVYTTLTEAGAERVRFVPNHMRLLFLSASVDVRHIRNRYFDAFHPDIPEGYRSKEAPSCEPGEFVVEWHRERPVCDCPRIADEYLWRAYHCAPPADASEQ